MKRSLLLSMAAVIRASLCAGLNAPPEPASTETKPLDYMIVVTGGELLEGAYADAHTHFLTRTLRPLGCRCIGSITVDDELEQIKQALRFAANKASLVIVTGGLGPTPNDVTRETLSEFTRIPLHEHPQALAELERRFKQTKDQLRPNLRRQALVPVQGGYLKNPDGSAVGLIFEGATRASMIVALPGPPRELQPMVKNELVPFLQRRFGIRSFGASLTLRFVGVGQSMIDQTIKDHVSIASDVDITSLFEASRVDFTFSLPGNSPLDRARLQRLEDALREHLGEYLYADDGSSLEEVVAKKMQGIGASLVLVEIGGGGHLAAALSGVPADSRLLTGAYSAPTAEAMTQLLQIPASQWRDWKSTGEQVKGMASTAANLLHAEWAVAVGPIEIDANGAKSVALAIKSPGGQVELQRVSIRDTGEIHRQNLTTQILDRLRRHAR